MKQTADHINELIDAITDPDSKLGDILLKVKVVAHKLGNQGLKDWVERELEGYGEEDEVPAYRLVPAVMFGDLIQDLGFGGSRQMTRAVLPVDALPPAFVKSTKEQEIRNSIFELDGMVKSDGTLQVHMPVQIAQHIARNALANDWHVQHCWKEIGKNSIEGIVGSVKNHLLTLMLNLSASMGELEKLEIASKTKRIDDMVKNSIGSITSETVNINFGEKVVQAGSSGSNNSVNAQAGELNEMMTPAQALSDVKALVAEIQSQMAQASVPHDQVAKIQAQLDLIGEELMASNPKSNVVSGLLKNVHGLLLGVAGNVFTPVVIEQASNLATLLSS